MTDFKTLKAGSAAVDPDDFNAIVDEVQSLADAGGGSSAVSSAAVSLSSAQILAMQSSPPTLVAAPGAGKVLVPLGVATAFVWVATGYTFASTVSMKVGQQGVICPQLAMALTGYDNENEFGFDWMLGGGGGGMGDDTGALADLPIRLVANGGDPTDGDGTAHLTVYYTTVTV